jgi:hypothetical protein
MAVEELLKRLFAWGPVWFGLGFVAPVVAQTLDAGSLEAPLALSSLQFGLAVGLVLGVVAKLRGRWV